MSKSAQADNFTLGTASINSGNSKRLSADINRALSPTSAFRINALAQDGGVMGHDVVENRSIGVAPSFVFGLGTPTRITVQSQHMRNDNTPDGGIPSIGIMLLL
ncbi:hypothetical protein LP419_31830 [Massilia sp. H-1]|nr:hypothetical protein LP419_31830 [Massilia sp. H-1]